MQVYLNMTSLPVGSQIGPTLNLIPTPAGPISPNPITLTELLNGVYVEVNDDTTNIRIKSTGECKSSINVSLPILPCTTTTTTTFVACTSCNVRFVFTQQNAVGVLVAGNVISFGSTCTVGEYVIDWYFNSTSNPVEFVTGSPGAPGIDQAHPLVGTTARPVLGGTWIPVIRYIVLNGTKYYSSDPDPVDGQYDPSLLNCLDEIVVQNINCTNSNFVPNPFNPSLIGYTHQFEYQIPSAVPGDASKTLRFDISPTTNYLAFFFTTGAISDRITFTYVSGLTQTTIGDFAVGQDIPANNPLSVPVEIDSGGFKHVLDLTGITYQPGDYIIIDITAGYINPLSTNTSWTLYLACLETFDDTIPARVGLDSCSAVMTYNPANCTYIAYIDPLPGYNNLIGTDIQKYYLLIGGGDYDPPFEVSIPIQSNCGTTSNAFYGCVVRPSSWTITKSGNIFTIQFADSTQYNDWLAAYNSATSFINTHNGGWTSDVTDIDYYRYYDFVVRTGVTQCGDLGTTFNITFHKTSTFTFDSGTNTLTIVGQSGVSNVGKYVAPIDPACTNCDDSFPYYNFAQQTLNRPDGVLLSTPVEQDRINAQVYQLGTFQLTGQQSASYILPLNTLGIPTTNFCQLPTFLRYFLYGIQVTITDLADPINNFEVYNMINVVTNCFGTTGTLIYKIDNGIVTTPSGGCS